MSLIILVSLEKKIILLFFCTVFVTIVTRHWYFHNVPKKIENFALLDGVFFFGNNILP